MFSSLSSESCFASMYGWCQRRSVLSNRQLPLENKFDEAKTLPYSNSAKCISQFLFLELYFFRRVTLFSVLKIFALEIFRPGSFKVKYLMYSMQYDDVSAISRLCTSISNGSGIILSLFSCSCLCFGQPALWNATIIYRELRATQKRRALRPATCAAPWGSCHTEVATSSWTFASGAKKQTLSDSQKLLSFVSGGIKLADTPVKGCFLRHECQEGSVNFGISRIVTPIKCCDYDLCNTHPAPGNTYMLYFFDLYDPVLCAVLFVKCFCKISA